MKKGLIYDVFSNIPTLETERCILRRMRIDDAEDMYAYAKLSEVTKYLRWSPHPDVYYTSDYLRFISKKYKNGEFYDWGIVDKESERLIGTCGFVSIDTSNKSAEIGYVLSPQYWKMGIATEVVTAVLDFGFSHLELNRIVGRYMVENTASLRVMEKCGMKFEGVARQGMFIKNKFRDIGYCSILWSDREDKV